MRYPLLAVVLLTIAVRPIGAQPSGCKFTIKPGAPSLEAYYPEQSKGMDEQGYVILEFSVPAEEEVASDVAVAWSSRFPRLDDAAICYVRDLKIQSGCPGHLHQLRVGFSLGQSR